MGQRGRMTTLRQPRSGPRVSTANVFDGDAACGGRVW